MLPNVYRKGKIFTIKAILASFPYKLVKETMKLHLIHFVGSEQSCGTVSNENSNLLAFEIHFNLISEQIKFPVAGKDSYSVYFSVLSVICLLRISLISCPQGKTMIGTCRWWSCPSWTVFTPDPPTCLWPSLRIWLHGFRGCTEIPPSGGCLSSSSTWCVLSRGSRKRCRRLASNWASNTPSLGQCLSFVTLYLFMLDVKGKTFIAVLPCCRLMENKNTDR